MTLQDLDAFLRLRESDAALAASLAEPLSIEALIELARGHGFQITEEDVFSAQAREDADAPSAELQRRMADDSRRLRHFIQG